jgi:hypothetical protein
MRENFPYVALRRIHQPDTLLYPYNEGDGLPANAVTEWGLVVGEDVAPVRDDVIAKPGDDADRAEWEAFAVGQGWTLEDARDASMKDLRAIPERDPEQPARRLDEPGPAPDRPAESDVKAEWIRWATANGADEQWANDKGTTKADLMEWQPEQSADEAATAERTDSVAEAADEQTNG